MNDIEFITSFISEFEQSALLYNEKIIFPAPLRKNMPDIKAGLTVAHRSILKILSKDGEQTVAKAANQALYTPQYTSRIAIDLFNKGFIEKYKSDCNKSKTYMNITQKGQQLLDENNKIKRKYIKSRMTKILDADERSRFLNSLCRINQICACFDDNGKFKNAPKEYDHDYDSYYKKIFSEFNVMICFINTLISESDKSPSKPFFEFNNCITHIYTSGEITMSELAKKTFVTIDAISKIVTQLVNNGAVERFQVPGDRRIYYVRVTETTRKGIDDNRVQFAAFLTERFQNTSIEDKQALIDSFRYVNAVFRRI